MATYKIKGENKMPIPDPATTVANETIYGISPSVGTGTKYARDDHTHGSPSAPSIPQPSTTVISEQTYGQSPSVGTLTTYAREDHTHGTPEIVFNNPLYLGSERILDTTYQNQTGKPIFVSVSCLTTAVAYSSIIAADIGQTNPPNLEVCIAGPFNTPSPVALFVNLSFIVPIGFFYKIRTDVNGGNSMSLNYWTEWT